MSRYVELLDRRPVVQQRQKLYLRRSQGHLRSLEVGFKLSPLQFQAILVDFRDVSCLDPLTTDLQHLIVKRKVLFRQFQDGLLLEDLYECTPQSK